MDKSEALNRLQTLLRELSDYEAVSALLNYHNSELNRLIHAYPSKLKLFDDEHHDVFIKERVGSKPVAPHGAIKIAVPIYLLKRKEYKKAFWAYSEKVSIAEEDYKEYFANERDSLIKQDKIEQAKAIEKKRSEIETIELSYNKARAVVENDDVLGESMKTKEIVSALISFLQNNRADTLKEAVNLWYDEKRKDEEAAKQEAHRQEILKLEKERVRAAKEAEDYARLLYLDAQNREVKIDQMADNLQKIADDYQ